MRLFPFGLFLLIGAVQPAPAQTLELRSGEVVIGHVTEFGEKSLKIDVSFPVPGTRTIERADVEPRSIYAVLAARIDQDDARAHFTLAGTCRELGLFPHAIAEAREAARRDPALLPDANRMIADLQDAIGADLLRRAEASFAEDRLGSARLTAQAVLRDYRNTGAAKDASDLLRRLDAGANGSLRHATAEQITAAVESARKELDRAAKDAQVPAHGRVKDQRRLERGVARLEQVWRSVGDLAPPDGVTLADRLSATQAELRQRLVDAYLGLGAIHLERRALPDADEWCNKACELDPGNQRLHRLHELILHAKLVSGWGY